MGEVAIISGAAGGIGSAVARQLLTARDDVCCGLIDVAVEALDALAESYGRDRVLAVEADTRSPDEVNRAVERVVAGFGPPTQLVTAAGVQFNCASEELPYPEWRRVLDINLDGTFFFCQAVGRRMLAEGRGSIVNITSISAYFGFPRRLAYIVSKAGLIGLTQTLAVEWADRGVRVNAVAPGFVDTPLVREAVNLGHVDESAARSHHALERFATPEEIAAWSASCCPTMPPLSRVRRFPWMAAFASRSSRGSEVLAGWRVGIDTGGTFTDIVAFGESGETRTGKVSSTPPNFDQGVLDALAAVGVQPSEIGLLAHGTTATTNAIITKTGARTGLVTTAGFRDVLELRRHNSEDLYDILWDPPEPLVPRRRRLGITERVNYAGEIITPLGETELSEIVERLKEEGAESLAICLLHSYANPAHELRLKHLLAELWPDVYVSISSDLLREPGEFERTSTTVANAYLGPILSRYVMRLQLRLEEADFGGRLMIMHSGEGCSRRRQHWRCRPELSLRVRPPARWQRKASRQRAPPPPRLPGPQPPRASSRSSASTWAAPAPISPLSAMGRQCSSTNIRQNLDLRFAFLPLTSWPSARAAAPLPGWTERAVRRSARRALVRGQGRLATRVAVCYPRLPTQT